jgi:hypothetical protein
MAEKHDLAMTPCEALAPTQNAGPAAAPHQRRLKRSITTQIPKDYGLIIDKIRQN